MSIGRGLVECRFLGAANRDFDTAGLGGSAGGGRCLESAFLTSSRSLLLLLHWPHVEKLWNQAEQLTYNTYQSENRPVAKMRSSGPGGFGRQEKEGAPPSPGMPGET